MSVHDVPQPNRRLPVRALLLTAIATLSATVVAPSRLLALGVSSAPRPAISFYLSSYGDSADIGEWREVGTEETDSYDPWPQAAYGDRILTDPEAWDPGRRFGKADGILDYNRVDPFRFGVVMQMQDPGTIYPRLGARIEYATGRERLLYGVQLEQPLAPSDLFAIGVTMARRTDRGDLHQLSDLENTVGMLFTRADHRDYFEREGFGAYASSRLGQLTTISVHVRSDEYRSLEARLGTGSLFHRSKQLRPNPPIDDGESRVICVLAERLSRRMRGRAGFFHSVAWERGGDRLGGDFDYARLLAEARSVLRLTPGTTLALRMLGGSELEGSLPVQREFALGGVDGLRAHHFTEYRGNQVALGQAEYTVSLWRLSERPRASGLQAIAFVDVGRAWNNDAHDWDLGRQRLAVDGGFGVGASDDRLRVYFAKNLKDPGSSFLVSARLQRPF